MLKAVSDTSPMLYLYRIGGIDWLPQLFSEVWVPEVVKSELQTGRSKGYDVPIPDDYSWLKVVNPKSISSQTLTANLGAGELAAISLALEKQNCVVLLDDMPARKVAQAKGVQVWGTLRILLEAKSHGIIEIVAPLVSKLNSSGMWISTEIKERILKLAGES
ncbi:MAG: DUF3368 domain-containing protein [Chloroherpetonaceae bacterium]